jgi:formamidopyrimidine-DNA glycosylase
MPELPEVETIIRTLAPRVTGRRILRVEFLAPRAALFAPDETAARLRGRTILEVTRHGKHLLFRLDQGWLDVHLRMTGKLLLDAAPSLHARAILVLDDGRLVFDDVRQFGYLCWRPDLTELATLGPDTLEISLDDLAARLRGRHGRIKPLLLNQTVVSGLGNIYVDEVLFRARLHPCTNASRLGPARLRRLHQAIRTVLEEAIEAGGSSISDYVDANGAPGTFQLRHLVYHREGAHCVHCGATIRRIVVAQRGTRFCPRCQRR